MRDYLDGLIERHTDEAPEIKPRLPSMFESEVSHGGLDVAVRDDRAIEMDETHPSAPPWRVEERIPRHSDTTIRAAAEPVPPIAAPSPTMPAMQGSPSIKPGLNEPVCFPSPQETPTLPPPSQEQGNEGVRGLNEGFPTSSAATLIAPVEGLKKPVFSPPLRETPALAPPSLGKAEEGVKGLNERFSTSSAVTLIAPVMGRVRHAHQEKRTEHTSPDPQVTAQRQPLIKEDLKKLVFSFSSRETPTLFPPSEGSEVWVRRLNQGLLTPSATSISPGYPSVARMESPASRPEPVIHVSIGRIEVRATMSAQKQAPRPEIRSRVMGLEEYLRRRSGEQDG